MTVKTNGTETWIIGVKDSLKIIWVAITVVIYALNDSILGSIDGEL